MLHLKIWEQAPGPLEKPGACVSRLVGDGRAIGGPGASCCSVGHACCQHGRGNPVNDPSPIIVHRPHHSSGHIQDDQQGREQSGVYGHAGSLLIRVRCIPIAPDTSCYRRDFAFINKAFRCFPLVESKPANPTPKASFTLLRFSKFNGFHLQKLQLVGRIFVFDHQLTSGTQKHSPSSQLKRLMDVHVSFEGIQKFLFGDGLQSYFAFRLISSTACILSPIHRITDTAMEFPMALYRGPSAARLFLYLIAV